MSSSVHFPSNSSDNVNLRHPEDPTSSESNLDPEETLTHEVGTTVLRHDNRSASPPRDLSSYTAESHQTENDLNAWKSMESRGKATPHDLEKQYTTRLKTQKVYAGVIALKFLPVAVAVASALVIGGPVGVIIAGVGLVSSRTFVTWAKQGLEELQKPGNVVDAEVKSTEDALKTLEEALNASSDDELTRDSQNLQKEEIPQQKGEKVTSYISAEKENPIGYSSEEREEAITFLQTSIGALKETIANNPSLEEINKELTKTNSLINKSTNPGREQLESKKKLEEQLRLCKQDQELLDTLNQRLAVLKAEKTEAGKAKTVEDVKRKPTEPAIPPIGGTQTPVTGLPPLTGDQER
jgi:hypothetical protein